MIVKRNFSPIKVWSYIKGPMTFVILWSVLVWGLYKHFQLSTVAINFTPIGILGSALAIFVAFRNNSSYGRWWEARTIWGGIVNSSRVLARLVITFSDSHSHQAQYDPDRSSRFKREMTYLMIAWAHALRIHLRGQDDWSDLEAFLSNADFEHLSHAHNKPNFLQLIMGRRIYQAMADGTLGGFDSFQLEGQLLALANYQGGCERIKHTPLPRQYDFFTRVFVLVFSFLLPFGLLGLFANTPGIDWLVVPMSVIVSGVFVVLERTGAANEDPFDNLITDVPMSALCNTIERDLKEMLGEKQLPPLLIAENGYLY